MIGLRNRIGRYGGRWRSMSRWESSLSQRDSDWSKYRNLINNTFEEIAVDKDYLSQLKARYIDVFSWKTFLNAYRRKLIKQPTSVISESDCAQLEAMMEKVDLGKVGTTDELADGAQGALKSILFQHAYGTALHDLKNVIVTNKTVCGASDLTMPHQWYPYARLMKRKIIYHGGPTNSGKTYHAIQRLKAANAAEGGGLYCGPLRLLALEIFETLNRSGVCTDLMTGQERKELPGSTHVSSTVEMVNINRQYDVAVIDEIQMIADRDRAHSWTRALLGLRAKEIHLCGGLEAAELVESLCQSTQDDFQLIKYDRMSNLEVESESLRGDYSKVRPGDCIVAFSIMEIFSIRKQIEQLTNLKCAVIYGQLPPETRSMQARLFNDENSGYDVLVASDAIGMGLNLNIGRIIFHTALKRWANEGTQYIEPTHIKQIAGRAGRRSSKYSVGKVTTWQEADLAYVRAVMQWDIPSIQAAGIFPTVEQVQQFLSQLQQQQKQQQSSTEQQKDALPIAGSTNAATEVEKEVETDTSSLQLSAVIQRFIGLSKIDSRYFMCNHDGFSTLSNWLHTIPLSLQDRFTFAAAPASFANAITMASLYEYAALYACGRPVPLNIRLFRGLPQDLPQFRMLCDRHNTLDLYLWLANRFPMNFIEREHCAIMKRFAIKQIETCLPSHSLQDTASIEAKYKNMRDKLKDFLPPATYGESLRTKTEEYLSAIDKNDLYVIVQRPDSAPTHSRLGRHPSKNTRDYKFGQRVVEKVLREKKKEEEGSSPAVVGQVLNSP